MSMIQCPECKADISDAASTCPNCGHPLKGSEPNKTSLMRAGAIVNIVAGAGFLVFLIFLFGSSASSDKSVSIGSSSTTIVLKGAADSMKWAEYLWLIALVAVLILSIVILIRKNMKRSQAIPMAAAQLVIATVGFVAIILAYNLGICCIYWMLTWATILQLVGSILCMVGATRIDV